MERSDSIDDIHLSNLQTLLNFPKDFLNTYQSLIEIRWPDDATEAVSVRRLLHCISASLALNGLEKLIYLHLIFDLLNKIY